MIHKIQIDEIAPRVFPAGRATRIVAGVAGLPSGQFAMGHTTVYPGGSVPGHSHPNEEIYVVLQGEGQITVSGTTLEVEPGTAVYMPPGEEHELRNPGSSNLVFMWVYAPATVVSHWAEESGGGEEGRKQR